MGEQTIPAPGYNLGDIVIVPHAAGPGQAVEIVGLLVEGEDLRLDRPARVEGAWSAWGYEVKDAVGKVRQVWEYEILAQLASTKW